MRLVLSEERIIMLNSFKNILIPVDLAGNTDVAVKKGLELADKDTIIHLLHVQNDSVNAKTLAVRKKIIFALTATVQSKKLKIISLK